MGSPTSIVSPGEGTATGMLVWVTGKKGSVVFIVFCLREPPSHPSHLIWYHSLFSIPKVSEGFLSFFFSSNICPYWWSLITRLIRAIQSPRGFPKGRFWPYKREVTVQCDGLLGVFSLLCGLLSSLHGSRMFQQKYGSNALELKVCFLVMLRSSMSYNKVVKCFFLLADK